MLGVVPSQVEGLRLAKKFFCKMLQKKCKQTFWPTQYFQGNVCEIKEKRSCGRKQVERGEINYKDQEVEDHMERNMKKNIYIYICMYN